MLTFYFKKLEKEEQCKPKPNRRKEIMNREDIDENRKTIEINQWN